MNFREPHFDWVLESRANDASDGVVPIYTWQNYRRDPRSLLFKLARYKFVAKILKGRGTVIEIGGGDGFAAPIVKQEVGRLIVTDVDSTFRKLAEEFLRHWAGIEVTAFEELVHNSSLPAAEAVYALDVLEHVPEEEERDFMSKISLLLRDDGIAVFGVPSPESQNYTSAENKEGHVNVKNVEGFVGLLQQYFDLVIDFGMNDEVTHTGFEKMRSYNFFVCHGPKRAFRQND